MQGGYLGFKGEIKGLRPGKNWMQGGYQGLRGKSRMQGGNQIFKEEI